MTARALIIANCFAFEIRRSLFQHKAFVEKYPQVDIISTYQTSALDSNLCTQIKNTNLVIAQNPKSPHWATRTNLNSLLSKNAQVLYVAFWRFNGFWPVDTLGQRENPHFWFPVGEVKNLKTFDDYVNFDIDTSLIQTTFDREYEKLSSIDAESDIPMLDFFTNNYRSTRVFSDDWHPYPSFFQELALRIVNMLGLKPSPTLTLPPLGVNNDRYRIIFNKVLDQLSLNHCAYSKKFFYFGKLISVEEYFYFSKFLTEQWNSIDINTQSKLKSLYIEFLKAGS